MLNAMAGVLVVPEALRKSILPRRSIAGERVAARRGGGETPLPKIRHAIVEKGAHGKNSKTHGAIFEAGTQTDDEPELRTLRKEALALLTEPSVEAFREASIDTLAGAEVMLHRAHHELSSFGILVALRGARDAVRVLCRSVALELTARNGGWTTAVWLGTNVRSHGSRLERWLPLRHAICAADQTAYGELVAFAQSLREAHDLAARSALAYVFPDEPWTNEDLRAAQTPGSPNCDFLLSAATDTGLLRTFAQSKAHVFATYAIDLAHMLPAPLLAELCAEALPALLKKPAYGPLLKTPPRLVVPGARVLANEGGRGRARPVCVARGALGDRARVLP